MFNITLFSDSRGKIFLEKLLFSICLVGYCLTFYYVDLVVFIFILSITFILYNFLLSYVNKNYAILISSGPIILVVNIYNPQMYRTLSEYIVWCFGYFYSVFFSSHAFWSRTRVISHILFDFFYILVSN